MRVSVVAVMLFLSCWTTVRSEPLLGVGLLAGAPIVGGILGLAALKAIATVKFGGFMGKRSVDDPAEEKENVLLSTVNELDQNGCIRKMLCQLQTKEETFRTPEEKLLAKMFANTTDSITTYNAAFVYATDIGVKTRNAAVCAKVFNKCPLGDAELSDLLQQSWGCGLDLPDDRIGQ